MTRQPLVAIGPALMLLAIAWSRMLRRRYDRGETHQGGKVSWRVHLFEDPSGIMALFIFGLLLTVVGVASVLENR